MMGFQKTRLVGKFALLFVLAGALVALGSFLALERILYPTFETIEARANSDQQARVASSLDEFNIALQSSAADYAFWDESYDYVLRPSAAFEVESFSDLAYKNQAVNYQAVIRFDGTPVWSKVLDPKTGALVREDTRLITDVVTTGSFAAQARKHERIGTYVRGAGGRIYSIQSVWIRKGDGSGEPSGYLLMGKLLSPDVLGDALRVKVTLNSRPDPQTEKAVLAAPKHSVATQSGGAIRNQIGLIDSVGKVQAVLGFDTPRTISQSGATAVRSAMIAMGISLVTLVALLALGINRIAVARLQSLRSHVASFRNGRRVIDPALLASDDEIGTLAREFDRLADELAEAEDELRRNSYVQGKADSAVGLLHNVRNALVPLQVKYDKWQQEDRLPMRGQLLQALDELAGDDCPAARRTALGTFAQTASRKLATLGATRSDEIIDIKHSVDQILSILSDYHFDSSAKPTVESLNVEALLRREAANLEAAMGTPVSLILPDILPHVQANHIHLNQIITNVMINAGESMKARGSGDWVLTVDSTVDPVTGVVDLTITDNGEGANADVIAHAFERGFSTRKDKSSGMGLHWSSNTMRAMGGELALESQGPGQGATVRLRLPLTPQIATALAA